MSWFFQVLWASVVTVQLALLMMIIQVPARNLTCFQCYNVDRANQCQPILCQPNEKVCVSRKDLHFLRIKRRTQFSKHCATSCSDSSDSTDFTLSTTTTFVFRKCCSWNLCNKAPGIWEGFWSLPGRLLLPMSLGLFCNLL